MALITKHYLVEQVQEFLSGGAPSAGQSFERKMIASFVQAAINKVLKAQYVNITLPSDETIPEGAVLACYDAIPVEKYKGSFSRAKLPASPLSLRRNMGVFFVGPSISNQNLSTPNIAATTIDANTINIMWGIVPHAGGYLLERAQDALFTVGLTSIYLGSNTGFIDTGLTTQTRYYYRLSVSAIGYTTSNYALINAITN